MTINKQNYLEVKQSTFLAVCSFCEKDITSSNDLRSCGTEGCLYKICSRSECHHFLENIYYCNNNFTINKSIDKYTSECLFKGSNNDDCVTVYRNSEGDKEYSISCTNT